MTDKLIKIFYLFLFFSLTTILMPYSALCQPPSLDEGINLYKAEKFDEAITVLTKARQEDPASSSAAFFLGLAYKQTMEYEKALGNLQDAVTLTPKIKEALIELIDVNLQLGKLDDAKKWIAVGEEENVLPAKTAFLKGIVLSEEGKNKEAADAFSKAKSLDPAIAQASDIQIAISHLKDSELNSAKESFQTAITADPQSDLAGFARRYLARVDDALFLKKPFHFTLSLFGQYDDNMVLKPTDQALASGVSNQDSLVLNSGFRVSYSPALKGPWLFNAYYALSSGLHQRFGDTHDSLANTISVTPGYDFGKYALNLAGIYSYALVRNPGYKKYSGNLSVGPMFRWAMRENQLLELFAGYADNKYYNQLMFIPEENRDSNGITSYASWVWLFQKNSFMNIRYQYVDQNAKGKNWENTSNALSANVVVPTSDSVKLQFSGEFTKMNFSNVNNIFDVKRSDQITNFSAAIVWEFHKNTTLIGQYTRIDNGSNIGIYDYLRNLYTVGLEYRF
jgi:tetratricopeptide (TPR) repeat protein